MNSNKMMRKNIKSCLFILLAAVVLNGCEADGDFTGLTFMPDMQYSNAYETFITVPEWGDTMLALEPVQGTSPRGWMPIDEASLSDDAAVTSYIMRKYFKHPNWYPELNEEQYAMAGTQLKNMLPNTKENLAEGKRLYNIYCAVCHGTEGTGNGWLVELPDGSDGPYTAVPPDYAARLKEITDGQMYYSITFGKGMMGGYGQQLNVEQRWQVVHYIKSLAKIDEEAVEAVEEVEELDEPVQQITIIKED